MLARLRASAFSLAALALAGIVGATFLPPPSVSADTLVGTASVIDGDTVEVHGVRIRLHGIDAPESAQECIAPDGRIWRCGQQASLALSDKIGRAPISCRRTDTDHYGRMIGICSQNGIDLNGWMVEMGWAVAYIRYSRDYAALEGLARTDGRGIWSSRFVMPWDWRRGDRITREAPQPRDPSCVIKGNINAAGERIYHVPGGQFYDRVRIDESGGQRWFCSESEARSAGWRRSAR